MIDVGTLRAAALPPLLLGTWHAYVQAVDDGVRRKALALCSELLDELDAGPAEDRERFARWLTVTLLDRSEGWMGQFGGGMTPGPTGYRRSLDWALSTHPLLSRVVVPHVLAACETEPRGRPVRWLYQCLLGQAWRLPPPDRERLEEAQARLCGPGADLGALLVLAGEHDPDARRWAEELESVGSAVMRVEHP